MFPYLMRLFLSRLLPSWMSDKTPEEDHFYRRLFTRKHQAKRALVRKLWIGAGILMVAVQSAPFVIFLSLFVTFISFSLLDETQ